MTDQLLGRRRPRHSSAAELWAREEAAAKRRALEDRLALHIKSFGLPIPEREYRFDEVRRWRFDFCWPEFKLAVEVEGLLPEGGRHQRMAGYEKDLDKLNAAAAAGWQVLRFTGTHVRTGAAVRRIEDALKAASERR
jgi:very-short-patch-repair endonuclease